MACSGLHQEILPITVALNEEPGAGRDHLDLLASCIVLLQLRAGLQTPTAYQATGPSLTEITAVLIRLPNADVLPTEEMFTTLHSYPLIPTTSLLAYTDCTKLSEIPLGLRKLLGYFIITRSRAVLPQELLALQEHSALNFSINGLLSVLGGWDGVSLSLEVNAHEPQVKSEQEQASKSRQVEQEQEQCVECELRTPRLYQQKKNRQGWLCAKCAPAKNTCRNTGCDFQDIGVEKMNNHIRYFCQRCTSCNLCKAALEPGMQLQQHYTTCRSIRVIPAGSRFLVRGKQEWQYFLVETAMGRVLCSCWNYAQKILKVYAPMPCEQLHLYRCEVRLEYEGNTRTHTPDSIYNQEWDWEVKCEEYNRTMNLDVYVHLQLYKNY